jgi:hypothetical protein
MEIKTIKVKNPSVIISADKYEDLKETLEILSDTELVKSISKALAEPKSNRKSHKEIFDKKCRSIRHWKNVYRKNSSNL